MPLWKFFEPFRATTIQGERESEESYSQVPLYLNVDGFEEYKTAYFGFAARHTAYDFAEAGFSCNKLAGYFADLILNAGELNNVSPQPRRMIQSLSDIYSITTEAGTFTSFSAIIVDDQAIRGYFGGIYLDDIQGVVSYGTTFYGVTSIVLFADVANIYDFAPKTKDRFAKLHLATLPISYFERTQIPSGNIFTRMSVVSGEIV